MGEFSIFTTQLEVLVRISRKMNENWLILAVQEQFIGQNQILPTFKGSRPKNQEATVIRIIKKKQQKKTPKETSYRNNHWTSDGSKKIRSKK